MDMLYEVYGGAKVTKIRYSHTRGEYKEAEEKIHAELYGNKQQILIAKARRTSKIGMVQ